MLRKYLPADRIASVAARGTGAAKPSSRNMSKPKGFDITRGLTRLQIQTFIWNAQADRQDAERAKRKPKRAK